MTILNIASQIAAILTAIAAAGTAIYLYVQKCRRRRVLEEYLKGVRRQEQGNVDKKGARTTYHLMAVLSLSESQLFDAAFGNRRIEVMREVGNEGKSVGVLFRWRKVGDNPPIEN